MEPKGQGPWPADKIIWRDGRPFLPEPPIVQLSQRAIQAKAVTTVDLAVEEHYEGLIKAFGQNGPDGPTIFSNATVLGPICEILQKKADAVGDHDPKHCGLYFHLGNCLLRLVEITDTIDRNALLEKSCYYLSQALSYLPKENPLRAQSWARYAYASVVRSQSDPSGPYLSDAVRHGQHSLDISTTAENSVTSLGNLAAILYHRYVEGSQLNDIQHGMSYLRSVIDKIVDNDDVRTEMLNLLGDMYSTLFTRTQLREDIEMAIHYQQKALTACNHGERIYSSISSSLATSYFLLSQQSSDVDHVNEAIAHGQRALAAASSDDPNRLKHETCLAECFKQRFLILRKTNTEDLELALTFQKRVLKHTPDDHWLLADRLFRYGDSLVERFLLLQNGEDFIDSFMAYAKGLLSDCAPVKRLRCGIKALKHISMLPPPYMDERVELANEILELIPDVLQRTNSRNDTQYMLQQISGVASFSTSVLTKAGESPLELVQKLETYRGLIIGLVIDMKSELLELKSENPELWSRYDRCRSALGSMNSRALRLNTQETYAAGLERHEQLHREFLSLTYEIRRCPGFERFQSSPTKDEVCELSQHGPVVCFNISSLESTAFLMTEDEVQALSLPGLQLDLVQRWVKMFSLRSNSTRRDGDLCEDDEEEDLESEVYDPQMELISLWNLAVKPVLRQLRILGDTPKGELPQIWWIGTGMMGLIPLHAAGDHSVGSVENTISHVVSSYSPTLRALQYVRTMPQISISEVKQNLLLVSMPTTQGGYTPLNVAEEVEAIENSTAQWASTTVLEHPEKTQVLQALKTCAIAHFACHGTADQIDPAKSALLVGKNSLEKLTVEDLDEISSDNARIVYLSACSTAEVKAMNLADESVHLASTFELTGFQHVIGTLWGADDQAAVEVAGNFYRNLPLHVDKCGFISVSRALHDAVLSFRSLEENRSDISKWAPFIHIGS